MTPIKEIEKRLVEMEFNDFYRWIVINMPRLSGADKKPTQKKRGGELTEFAHPSTTQLVEVLKLFGVTEAQDVASKRCESQEKFLHSMLI
jgi:hypothetical protein